jgi:DNA-binding transcriptional MocR family regulator
VGDAPEVHVSLVGRRDLAGEIYRQLRRAILDGRLLPGGRLPPTRELARRLSVSRTTVAVAYDRLTGEGFVTARVGVGTFVSEAAGPRGRPRPAGGALRPRAVGDGTYGDPAGHPGLRQAIARHIGASRAVQASPGQVVVANGTQQAVDLVARVLLEPGDRVAVETPGYGPPRRLLTSLGAEVVGRSSPCRPWTRAAGSCTWGRSPRPCWPPCASGSWSCPSRWSPRSGRPSSWRTGTPPCPSRPPWPGSSTRATWPATSAACAWDAGTPSQPGFALGYGAIGTDRIEEGLARLRRCFDG